MKYQYETKIIYGEYSLDPEIKRMGELGFRVSKIDKYEIGEDEWNEYNQQIKWKQRQYVIIFEKELDDKKDKRLVSIKLD